MAHKTKTIIEAQAQALNAHHAKHAAGFYNRQMPSRRYFQARAHIEGDKQVLQVSPDFGETWETVHPDEMTFHSYWGNVVALPEVLA